ncbi:beta-galactosidase-1-like protein isoform X1 [Coregonus clupeaformis]|uniref:beta-galactosidase-1-like protein isoform X1 n=1 Tax=Coregonus clupeaformis TaxID=59861 RepID=UPI001BDF75CC|nr:beta-galactosidase-1-like protein isoform X1 [Coregonus clupeaformis]
MDTKTVFSLVFFACLAVNRTVVSGARSFSIDYNNNCFQKDGKPFQYISGSIHYSRIPQYYWRDRLLKMYMAGLNAVQIYVPWNFHEEKQGVYNFSGDRDLENFLDLANQTGLLVILRPGPYICAEWEMGGLPAWLLQKPNIVLRSADTDYLEAVTTWMAVLLPKMRRWLYTNGGNIITVQVENEYGSYYVCDYNYMRHLRTLFQFFLGENTVLFTTDGNTDREMTCGTLEGMYATIDFGTDVNISQAFRRQRRFEPRGPLVNSEFYTGWLDHWGDKHAQVDTQKVSRMLGEMLSMGANVNMYMFEGGTNFGYWNGADHDNRFRSVVTSYDYNAPLSEAGDSTEKLLGIRDTISKFRDIPVGPMPPASPKMAYGFVTLTMVGNLSSLLDTLSPQGPVRSRYPLSFEEMKQYYGFMLYRTKLPRDLPEDTPLISPLNGVHDRAYVSVCGVFQGLLERDTTLVMNVTGKEGDQIDVLVENMGRVNFGSKINDFKGLLSNLVLGEDVLTDWQIYPLDIDGAIASGWPQSGQRRSPPGPVRGPSDGPVFYQGTLPPNGLAWDTFLRLNEWTKGQVWINGMNLGRYWPKRGPQQTLYVPGPLLSPTQPNNITVLELERAPPHTRVLFMDRPQLGSTAGKT